MNASTVLLALTAGALLVSAYGLWLALSHRRARSTVPDATPTWSLGSPEVRGLVVFLAGSSIAISALVLWLGIT